MKHRPIIGISGSYVVDKQQILIRDTYTSAVLNAGGLPVVLPTTADERFIDEMLNCVDGILLSGGGDVNPARYGAETAPECGMPTPLRDAFEIQLIKKALSREMPIFGICRGVQVLCVACGGTLIQDIPAHLNVAREVHYQCEPYSALWHSVHLTAGGLLNRITGETQFMTNSMHHQSILELGPDLKVEAVAEDGIIEAVSHRKNPAVFGVQFHPEYFVDQSKAAQALFTYFVEKAACFSSVHRSAD